MMQTANKVEELVWTACCAVVGVEGKPLDAHANLFDLGLDSLGLAELVIQYKSRRPNAGTADVVARAPFTPCATCCAL